MQGQTRANSLHHPQAKFVWFVVIIRSTTSNLESETRLGLPTDEQNNSQSDLGASGDSGVPE